MINANWIDAFQVQWTHEELYNGALRLSGIELCCSCCWTLIFYISYLCLSCQLLLLISVSSFTFLFISSLNWRFLSFRSFSVSFSVLVPYFLFIFFVPFLLFLFSTSLSLFLPLFSISFNRLHPFCWCFLLFYFFLHNIKIFPELLLLISLSLLLSLFPPLPSLYFLPSLSFFHMSYFSFLIISLLSHLPLLLH